MVQRVLAHAYSNKSAPRQQANEGGDSRAGWGRVGMTGTTTTGSTSIRDAPAWGARHGGVGFLGEGANVGRGRLDLALPTCVSMRRVMTDAGELITKPTPTRTLYIAIRPWPTVTTYQGPKDKPCDRPTLPVPLHPFWEQHAGEMYAPTEGAWLISCLRSRGRQLRRSASPLEAPPRWKPWPAAAGRRSKEAAVENTNSSDEGGTRLWGNDRGRRRRSPGSTPKVPSPVGPRGRAQRLCRDPVAGPIAGLSTASPSYQGTAGFRCGSGCLSM